MIRRSLVVFFSLLVVVASAVLVKSTIKPFSITSVLSESDPIYRQYAEHEAKYRDELQVYVLLESPTPWTERADFQQRLGEVTAELKKVPHLANVTSLFDAEYVVRDDQRRRTGRVVELAQQVGGDAGDQRGLAVVDMSYYSHDRGPRVHDAGQYIVY